MADDPNKVSVRPGDTKVYSDALTDTATGLPITADLQDGTWTATCQIRVNYDKTSPVIATFACVITDGHTVRRTLTEIESLKLDDVTFDPEDTDKTGTRKVYWDAQLRKAAGLAAGSDYVLTYLSGTITLLGQVSRAL